MVRPSGFSKVFIPFDFWSQGINTLLKPEGLTSVYSFKKVQRNVVYVRVRITQ